MVLAHALPPETPVLVWGASGHALVVADILRLCRTTVAGYIDDVNSDRAGEVFGGASVLGGRDVLRDCYARGIRHGVVAIGSNPARLHLVELLEEHGVQAVVAVHPSATVAGDAVMAAGCVVAAGAVVGVRARLGRAVIVNTTASVDHECAVGDGVHLSPGSHLCGRVHIGELAWIGAGSTVIDEVAIGARAIVGAGAVVIEDVPPGVTAVGVPARVVKPAAREEASPRSARIP